MLLHLQIHTLTKCAEYLTHQWSIVTQYWNLLIWLLKQHLSYLYLKESKWQLVRLTLTSICLCKHQIKHGRIQSNSDWLLSMELSQPRPQPLTHSPLLEVQAHHISAKTRTFLILSSWLALHRGCYAWICQLQTTTRCILTPPSWLWSGRHWI